MHAIPYSILHCSVHHTVFPDVQHKGDKSVEVGILRRRWSRRKSLWSENIYFRFTTNLPLPHDVMEVTLHRIIEPEG